MKNKALAAVVKCLPFNLALIAILFTSMISKAQDDRGFHHEFPDSEYKASPRSTHAKSPAYSYYSTGFSMVQVNVDEDGYNIVDDAANEPSIAFNPLNPDQIAIGWRQFDDISSNFRQAGNAFTNDGGETWTFPGPIDPGVFRSDPVLGYDRQGNLYYNSLTVVGDDYFTNTYISYDGGETWEMGTFAQGGDKQWMSIDRSGGIGDGNIYEFWNGYYSICSPHNFTRSTNGNLSYETCTSIPGDPFWGTTFVSPDGDVFVSGRYYDGGFMIARSTSAQDPGMGVFWDLLVTVDLDGEASQNGSNSSPNPGGLLGQVIITMDSTGGEGDGNIYMLCSVDRYTTPDPRDVMFARSTDGGWNWSEPVRVNDDFSNTAYQWFGTMSVAPDGRIDVIWLDTRENPGSVFSSLYYSYSLDQGNTWSVNEKLSESFHPHLGWPQQDKMGDYFDMYSDEFGAHLAWAGTFNGEQDVYYSLIVPDYVRVDEIENQQDIATLTSYPNPCREQATISFQLKNKAPVTLKVFTMSGAEVATLLDEVKDAGQHSINFRASGLESGVYYYRLQAGNSSVQRRLVVLK
jgi:hypothetical protein